MSGGRFDMNKNNKSIIQLIDDVKEKCIKLGVKINLSEEDHVIYSESIKSGGYFSDGLDMSDKVPVFACGMGQKDYEKTILLFIHESCHLDQWSERNESNSLWSNGDTSVQIDQWLSGVEFKEEELDFFFKNTMNLELDCEKRSVEKIKKYNIPTNIEHYIQKSNSYILFYNYLRKYRKWYNAGNPPYGDNIWPHAPNYWLENYDIIPEELEKAYDEYLGIK